MLKLLYIATNLQSSGGVSRVLSVRTNYLITVHNYEIHFINTNNSGITPFYDFNSKIVFHEITIENFGFQNIGFYKKQLQTIIQNVTPSIIVNCDNGLKGSLFTYLVKSDIPLIYELHRSKKIKTNTFHQSIKNKISNIFLKFNQNKYKAFVVLNEASSFNWKSHNTTVISNPLCFEFPEKGSELKNKKAIAVGRHSSEKQFDKLIEIWSEVIKDKSDWVLEIYGQSDIDNKLESLVDKLNLVDNVKIHEPINNIEAIYLKASMLLNTSISEAFGLVIIEAMAYGIPVVGFDKAEGLKSIVTDGYNGFLVKNNDKNVFRDKIIMLINSKKLREKVGLNGRATAQFYNLEIIMNDWIKLYKKLTS